MDLREHKRRLKLMMPDDKPNTIAAKERPRTDIYVEPDSITISSQDGDKFNIITLTGRSKEILEREVLYQNRKLMKITPERAN